MKRRAAAEATVGQRHHHHHHHSSCSCFLDCVCVYASHQQSVYAYNLGRSKFLLLLLHLLPSKWPLAAELLMRMCTWKKGKFRTHKSGWWNKKISWDCCSRTYVGDFEPRYSLFKLMSDMTTPMTPTTMSCRCAAHIEIRALILSSSWVSAV